jgi:competence protein CoiA
MLSAKRKSDGQIVTAYFSSKIHGPFLCQQCNEEVILKTGRNRVDHFAHANPIACKFAEGESELHRRCKMEIFEALKCWPGVRKVELERPIGLNRADVSAEIRGTPVAIEVQISSLPIETILERTIEYGRNGVYVLWLLQWTPKLDTARYAPRPWEKWIHACYFGRVYYWLEALSVLSYHFDPAFRTVPRASWYSEGGKKRTGGGYSSRLKRHRTPVRGATLNLVEDFMPQRRYWWEGNGMKVPDARLFIDKGFRPPGIRDAN